ncbi:MAG: NUDIX hydrolase [Candidatus Bathyarchaeota archaeon]|nr:MAG: NUDIX hydrolase [Candidatus Bathyarchaeota archaeon]
MKREYPTQPIIGVGALIIHEDRIVLVKRGVEPGKSQWSIPGGAVELGEGVRAAAVREAKEECGLDIEIVDNRPIDEVDNIFKDEKGGFKYHYVLLQFLVEPKGGELKPGGDVLDARWIPLGGVENLKLTRSFRLFFKKHIDELKGF